MANGIPWTCPYCGRAATITDENFFTNMEIFDKGNKDGLLGFRVAVFTCPIPECREYDISAYLMKVRYHPNLEEIGDPLIRWQLKPQSGAKVFPDYVPAPIIADYNEACLIRDLSPKASATLSRRCLQGIIRDFWGITKGTLFSEINELKPKVDASTWGAIDAVRSIGNIGAHMEKDINLIVDVEPHEAQLLIGLIEILVKDWYVARHDREEHLNSIIALATEKQELKKGSAG